MASCPLLFPLMLLAVCDAGSMPVQLRGKGRIQLSDSSVSDHGAPSNVSNVTSSHSEKSWNDFRSRGNLTNATRFAHIHGLRAFGSDCGRPEVAAALASFAIYDSGLVEQLISTSDVNYAKSALESAGFSIANKFEVSGGPCPSLITGEEVVDHDASHLWKRKSDGHCLLAFRGSNCGADGFAATPTHMFKYGRDINHHVLVNEFEPLLEKMAETDFADCSKLDVTGHSLGASLASIFAVLSNDGKLGLGKSVDGMYLLAPPKVFSGETPANAQSQDGCFTGGIYCNYVEEDGVLKVDEACHAYPGDYNPPKTDYVKIGATSGTTPCAQVTNDILMADPVKSGLSVHMPQHYLNGLGCSDAQIPLRG